MSFTFISLRYSTNVKYNIFCKACRDMFQETEQLSLSFLPPPSYLQPLLYCVRKLFFPLMAYGRITREQTISLVWPAGETISSSPFPLTPWTWFGISTKWWQTDYMSYFLENSYYLPLQAKERSIILGYWWKGGSNKVIGTTFLP